MDRQPLTDRLGDRLLAEYGGAAAAYSLRALNGNGDSVVRVRRSSDDAEQDFTAAQVSDGTLESFCGVGDGFVATWYDQSGNGNDLTQSVADNQPKIVDGGSYLDDGLKFDGVNDVFNYLDSGTTDDASIFTVSTRGTITNDSSRTAGYKGSAANAKLTFAQANDGSLRFDGAAAITSSLTLPASGLYLRSSFKTLTTAKDFVNGSSNIDESISLVPTTKQYSLAGVRADGNVAFDGNIKEVIFYNSDQSADRTAIEGNINAHYNIY